MTEPEPCPFEQAASLSYENDDDLLANVEGSQEGERHQTRDKGDVLTLADLKTGSDNGKSSERISIGQDMVEPADAPPVFSRSDRSESEANVSVNGAEDAVTINKIGVTKEYNLMLGVN